MHRPTYLFAIVMTVCGAVALAQDAGPLIQADDKDKPGQAAQDRTGQAEPAGERMSDRDRAGAGGGISVQGSQQMDQDFVKHAASANLLEVRLSELVQQKARDPQVKQFAQRLVEDHRKAGEQLKQVAQQMNVQISDELMPMHQAKLDHFQQKQPGQLELGYVFDQVGHHHKDVLEYQFMAQNAQNAQLKQFASQTLPHLRQHLQMAERLAPGGGAEARTAGERMPPGDDSGHIGGHRGTGTGTGQGTTGDR